MAKDSENIISNPKLIADTLQNQFKSVFTSSVPATSVREDLLSIDNEISELQITNEDVIEAIGEIKPCAGCPKYDVPARVLKECKLTLCVPLRLFWEKSFSHGIIPKLYISQQIIPVHKKGSKTQAHNFRPIALTSHIIKIFERILRKKLVEYFERNQILKSNQHGFRKNHSCSTQLLTHTHNVLSGLIRGNEVDSIYIDYSKAFDKVDHNLLLEKLQHYGVNGKYIAWIESFLKGRSQTVYINGACSYPTPVSSGVPQGSVLGPLLFIIFINDLPDTLLHSHILTFADDTKLIKEIYKSDDNSLLQNDLINVINWSHENRMTLNDEKFELICHKPNRYYQNLQSLKELPFSDQFSNYKISNDNILSPSPIVRDLGLYVTSDLSWDVHINKLCKKATQISAWVLHVFYTRDRVVMMTLFNSLIRSLLEYCPEVWNPHKNKDIVSIEQIQRTFTSKITGLKDLNYWERLKELGILSLQRRRERILITIVWKIKNGFYPNNINLNFKSHKWCWCFTCYFAANA